MNSIPSSVLSKEFRCLWRQLELELGSSSKGGSGEGTPLLESEGMPVEGTES